MGEEAWNGHNQWSPEQTVSYEDAVRESETRIFFMGPRRSGKSSVERVVFHKLSPHETLFIQPTQEVLINEIANNDLLRFQTWDFGGDLDLLQDVTYQGKKIPLNVIFRNCSTLLYVIDAQEDDYQDAFPKLIDTITKAHEINPKIHFEVFLHKVDGDYMTDETKAERQQEVQHFVSSGLSDSNGEVLVSYHLTSIYDHTTLEAFSKVVQKLVPQLPVLNSLLDILIASSNIEKSYLVDVKTKLYIATDSNPVDVQSYELCSDLVDVVLDVSHIYGIKQGVGAAGGTDDIGGGSGADTTYDSDSSAAIRLSTGIVLYLRQVSDMLALICLLREEHFAKRSVLDYNIDCLRSSLLKVIQVGRGAPRVSAGGGGGGGVPAAVAAVATSAVEKDEK